MKNEFDKFLFSEITVMATIDKLAVYVNQTCFNLGLNCACKIKPYKQINKKAATAVINQNSKADIAYKMVG